MPIEITPTLELMSTIYRLSASGGAESERFRTYRAHAEDRKPIHGYNPMTREPVADTIDALMAIDAEALALEAANGIAEHLELSGRVTMHLSVATPGAWTDHFGTEIDHRVAMTDPAGVLLWHGEPVDDTTVRRETAAQAVRLIMYRRRGGPPHTLGDVVAQEGLALACAGEVGNLDSAASDVLDVLSDDESRATMVGFLYGDSAAADMGYPGVGLSGRAGYDHAVALHRDASA